MSNLTATLYQIDRELCRIETADSGMYSLGGTSDGDKVKSSTNLHGQEEKWCDGIDAKDVSIGHIAALVLDLLDNDIESVRKLPEPYRSAVVCQILLGRRWHSQTEVNDGLRRLNEMLNSRK
ncbi:MAG: hypothetical protein HUJ63_12195 [Enterococcus sp.]|nr:hypothetical protein [Enterococcus sp.]